MARPRQRLSLYPEPAPGESPSGREYGTTVTNAVSGGTPGGTQNFTAQKSQVLKRLAETLVELDKTEAIHFDALFEEEQNARQRYIQQFQSVAGKVQQLSEELEVDRHFRQEYHVAIAKYTQEQSQEIEAFAQDMVQLRDLEHMVRGHLPVQLEALASLAHDIQMELKQKADMNATKSRLTQINQRLARLEEVIETKASRSELEAQQERMAAIIPDRDRLARCFEMIAPAIREPSTRQTTQAKVQGSATGSHKAGVAAKTGKSGKAKSGGPHLESEAKDHKRHSKSTTEQGEPPSPHPSVGEGSAEQEKKKEGPKEKEKAKSSASVAPKHPSAAKPSPPPPAGHETKPTTPPTEGKAVGHTPPPKPAASKAMAKGAHPAVPKDEAVPAAKATEASQAAQPKA